MLIRAFFPKTSRYTSEGEEASSKLTNVELSYSTFTIYAVNTYALIKLSQ